MTSTRTRATEQGFTLVEVLVVLIIVAVLFAAAIGMFGSGKRASASQQGAAVARIYANAAIDFAIDNGGSVPVPGGASSDWPTTAPERGPVDKLQKTSSQRYLKRVPDSVASGTRVVLGARPPAGVKRAVTYQVTSAITWRVTAWVDGVAQCALTNEATQPPGLRRC